MARPVFGSRLPLIRVVNRPFRRRAHGAVAAGVSRLTANDCWTAARMSAGFRKYRAATDRTACTAGLRLVRTTRLRGRRDPNTGRARDGPPYAEVMVCERHESAGRVVAGGGPRSAPTARDRWNACAAILVARSVPVIRAVANRLRRARASVQMSLKPSLTRHDVGAAPRCSGRPEQAEGAATVRAARVPGARRWPAAGHHPPRAISALYAQYAWPAGSAITACLRNATAFRKPSAPDIMLSSCSMLMT